MEKGKADVPVVELLLDMGIIAVKMIGKTISGHPVEGVKSGFKHAAIKSASYMSRYITQKEKD